MRKNAFGEELIASAQEALAHARGQKKLREWTVVIPDPVKPWSSKRIATLRKMRFRLSQPRFAELLNVTASTVRAWEQGYKRPSGAASRLLQVADEAPSVFERLAHPA